MQSIESLVELFRQKGLKITPQRRGIFELLVNDESHPTAEEIYQRVAAVMPDISRTTVYNTLADLVTLDELSAVENLSEGGIRYDTNVDSHHHLFCMGCHTLIDIGRDFNGLELSSEETSGYQIVKRQVTFYGYCPQCQAKQTGAPGMIS
jgi:Fur family peroxide stress response transcriptional regulator